MNKPKIEKTTIGRLPCGHPQSARRYQGGEPFCPYCEPEKVGNSEPDAEASERVPAAPPPDALAAAYLRIEELEQKLEWGRVKRARLKLRVRKLEASQAGSVRLQVKERFARLKLEAGR